VMLPYKVSRCTIRFRVVVVAKPVCQCCKVQR
jgi:hypothetical protein